MDPKQEAKTLKNSQLLSDIFDECELSIIGAWKSAPTVETREQCASDLKALETLRETFYAKTESIIAGN